ncbi:histidinol phosphate phosphatase [Oscillospiraceae bacterium]|nr:histidinol phosphate phosphatase [Oscillospiraceae bacterium]
MFLADYHTHSLCSPDSSAPLVQMAQAALDAGMDELCLTDHCDLLSADGKLDLSFRWEGVEEQLAQARAQFAGRLPIRMGLELGEPWEAPQEAARIVSHPELDFVIGSVHNQGRAAGGVDFYYIDYRGEEACHTALDDYFSCMEALAALDCWDVLGHVIYPLRYMNGRDGNHVTLDRYTERIRSIFRTVIAKGKGIEVNTCRGRSVEDWRSILALYRSCGGTLVTLGSDAHSPGDVAKGLPAAARLLGEMGFDSIAVYERRRPKLVKL